MKLITRRDAASRSNSELHIMLRKSFNALSGISGQPSKRKIATVSKQNVQTALSNRMSNV